MGRVGEGFGLSYKLCFPGPQALASQLSVTQGHFTSQSCLTCKPGTEGLSWVGVGLHGLSRVVIHFNVIKTCAFVVVALLLNLK